MYILHGTWVPQETDEFIQDGDFYLWVETGALKNTPPGYTVKFMSPKELAEFLADELGLFKLRTEGIRRRSDTLHLYLPGVEGQSLPSPELARSLGLPAPEEEMEVALVAQTVTAYPLDSVLKDLHDLHFLASYQRDDVELGQDLLFWIHFAHSLQQVLRKDQYIPALRCRELSPPKGKRKSTGHFEIHPAWDIVSSDYETHLRRTRDQMPLACLSASRTAADSPRVYDKEGLLRHFSECVLDAIVTRTPMPAVFDRKIEGTLLQDCLRRQTSQDLERYKQWREWQETLTPPQEGDFQLGFQLLEGEDEQSPWHLEFLATSRRDPSLKLRLDDYWDLTAKARKALLRSLGQDFERQLLGSLGHAARMYPRLWQGLETDRPTGLTLSLEEAFGFLKEHAWVLEDAGFKVIVPAWWTPEGRQRARLRLVAGGARKTSAGGPGYFSLDSLVQYRYELAIGGEAVTEEEWQQLVEAKTPLVQFRGQWVELERDKMEQLLAFWQTHGHGTAQMPLGELLQRASGEEEEVDVSRDSTLAEMLTKLQEPARLEPIADPSGLNGALREYQKRGVAWLQFLESLGLNGCLADDMGLGKTLQVIVRVLTAPANAEPTLLIAPTSVVGNWQKEVEKFAPGLKTLIHHGVGREQEVKAFKAACRAQDIVITSFNLARRDAKLLQGMNWRRIVVDEAQNIKNPNTAQTKAILGLKASHRLALTGTPVENRLLDLWSIFNFLSPGYLGKQAQFRKQFELPIQKDNDPSRATLLKKLVQPFILRRVKTDKAIIKDLPDKVEHKQYCNLTQEQASLYEAVVKEVERTLNEAEGIQRKGLILATLTKLKQICNHPRQFLQDKSDFAPQRSHKLQRLTEMLEEVLAEGESLLVFTQFTEIGASLERYLTRTLHCPAYYLHGGVSRTRRERMITAFQDPEGEPAVFVLSLKAGGVGLNLTRANHVFHFDRWWNPAVEDQATDRAFRIGQTRNVFVHKFITLGTLEERIDQMIEDKKQLAGTIVGADESWLTELDNESFRQLIALNRNTVME